MKQKQDDPFYIPIIIVVFILIFSCIIYRVWLKNIFQFQLAIFTHIGEFFVQDVDVQELLFIY